MNSPLLDASAVTPNPATVNLTPRQRLEGALAQLPAVAGSAAAQSQSSQPALLDRQELVEPVQRINESLAGFGVESSSASRASIWSHGLSTARAAS